MSDPTAKVFERVKQVLGEEIRAGTKPMTFTAGTFNGLVRALGAVVAHVGHLEAEIAELRGKSLNYEGHFKTHRTYRAGDCVSWKGSLWHCRAPATSAQPDTDQQAWQLAVRKGRDGSRQKGTHHDDD